MSGFAGVYRTNGPAPSAGELDGVLDWLRPRGPDAEGRWAAGPAALAHRLLATTPEAAPGQQPFERDGCVVAADVRLDNRSALQRQLDVPSDAPDVAYLWAAYDRWGRRCPEHLLGAFAFAVWDVRRDRLLLARDHLGVKPLAYAETDAGLAFASEPAALLGHDAVPFEIDEPWIAAFLRGDFDDTEATAFESVRRLPPAHTLIADAESIRLDRYWTLEADSDRVPDSDEARIRRFRDLFREAVRCRLRGADPGGSLLSGGLDSSSIACTAAALHDRSLHTLSAYSTAFPEADERAHVEAVLDAHAFEPHYVCLDGVRPLVDRERLVRRIGLPVRAPNQFLTWALYRRAEAEGLRVVLHGLHGDVVVSTGLGRLPALAREGRVVTLLREIDLLSRQTERGSRRQLARRALGPNAPGWVRRHWRRLYDRTDAGEAGLLDPDFLASLDAEDRRENGQWRRSQSDRHLERLRSGLVTYATEDTERAAAAFGVEPRFPFLDKRLVEYCVSLPADLKLRDGWPRYVLRRAGPGGLPDRVRWRGDKGSYSRLTAHAIRTYEGDRLERIAESRSGWLEAAVDWSRFRDRCAELEDGGDQATDAWLVLALAEWMEVWVDAGGKSRPTPPPSSGQ